MDNKVDEEVYEHHVTAPITGMITNLYVKKGDKVISGQELFTLEAMKMENIVCAEQNSLIKEVKIKPGQSVRAEEVVIEYDKN